MATTPEFFSKFRPDADTEWKLAQGTFFKGTYDVVMGASAASASGMRVGDKVIVTHGTDDHGHAHDENPFTVVGILAPTGSAHDRAVFITLDSTWLMHADEKRHAKDPHAEEPTPENLTPEERLITGAYLSVRGRPGEGGRGGAAPPLVPAVYNDLRKDTSLTVALPSQEVAKLFTIVSNVDQIFVAMAAAVMVTSAFAIMLALYNTMEQRRRQIAVLRVLGASRGRVFGLILTESTLIGLVGCVAGVGLCLLGVRVVGVVLRARLGLVIDGSLDPRSALLVAAGAVMLAALAGVLPGIVAYRTSVARSLRPLA